MKAHIGTTMSRSTHCRSDLGSMIANLKGAPRASHELLFETTSDEVHEDVPISAQLAA